jgi:hypothetical protein
MGTKREAGAPNAAGHTSHAGPFAAAAFTGGFIPV